MRKENDVAPVKAIIKATTMDIFDHYRESYTESDIINLTESIMRLGYMINGLDFGVFKTKAISGEYKNRVQIIDGREFKVTFFRLSPDVYLDWFQEYIFQRGEAFANNSHTIHKSTVKESSEVSPEAAEKLKEIADRLKPTEPEKSKPMEESKEQKQTKELQKWIEKEFIENCEFGIFESGKEISFIEKKGKKYLKPEYVKLRFTEIYKELGERYNLYMNTSGEPILSRPIRTVWIYNEIEKLIS